MNRKGIILAGGRGKRLYPLTRGTSKQLLPVYDKPLIYYPISTLMDCGITEIAIIVAKGETERFKKVLGDGSQWGLQFTYFIQSAPRGIAEAFIITEKWLGKSNVVLALGDNIFHGTAFKNQLTSIHESKDSLNLIFGYRVGNPSEYGVVEFDEKLKVKRIVEKPTEFVSMYAVPGLYFYDNSCINKAKSLTPSPRGELEITDINNLYMREGKLEVRLLDPGTAWLDTGSADSLLDAAEFVRVMQRRTGVSVCDPSRYTTNEGGK